MAWLPGVIMILDENRKRRDDDEVLYSHRYHEPFTDSDSNAERSQFVRQADNDYAVVFWAFVIFDIIAIGLFALGVTGNL